jgi:hypothetical protein
MAGLLDDVLQYMQDPRRTQQLQGTGRAIQQGLLSIEEKDKKFQDLYDKAFGDPKNIAKVTDKKALSELTEMMMAGPMSIAPIGMTQNVSKASARNVKKGSVATVFDNVTDYNEAMKLAQKGAHLKQDPSGQYIGGPRSTGPVGLTVDSPGALSNMRQRADKKVEAGAFNASWYDRARQAAESASGYNPTNMTAGMPPQG